MRFAESSIEVKQLVHSAGQAAATNVEYRWMKMLAEDECTSDKATQIYNEANKYKKYNGCVIRSHVPTVVWKLAQSWTTKFGKNLDSI